MPLKRKGRPESWSSDSVSPEEKKARDKKLSTVSETDDEVSKGLTIADDLGRKVDQILEKLKKLNSTNMTN